MVSRIGVVFLSIWLLACAAVGQVATEQVVAAAFPSDLVDPQFPDLRHQTYVVTDLNRDGNPLIVALYTNGSRAAIVVLDAAGQVIARPNLRAFRGFDGELELADLDGDGTPEVIARLYFGQGLPVPDSWVFRWSNRQLTLVSPVAHVGRLDVTKLKQVAVVNFVGDGTKQLLAFPGAKRNDAGEIVDVGQTTLYGWSSDGKLMKLPNRFVFAGTFFRSAGQPVEQPSTFAAQSGPATVHVLNGALSGGSVDSGHIVLNGQEAIGPSKFKNRVARTDGSAELRDGTNSISVKLEGMPGAGIWVLVEPASSVTTSVKKTK